MHCMLNVFNIKMLVGGTISIFPMLVMYYITSDYVYIMSSIVSISFFYICATEVNIKSVLFLFLLVYLISELLFFSLPSKYILIYPLIIIISFLSIILRFFNFKKSTGLYCSVSILFFVFPLHDKLMDFEGGVFFINSLLLISSALYPLILSYIFNIRGTRIIECEYVNRRQPTLESLSLLISSSSCYFISIFLNGDDMAMIMWSCIVVNSCEVSKAKEKFRERLLPGMLGICVGYISGMLIKDINGVLLFSSYVTMVSLVCFKKYSFGFFIRCVSFPIAVCAMCQSDQGIYLRAYEIIIGGVISMSSVFLVYFTSRFFIGIKN